MVVFVMALNLSVSGCNKNNYIQYQVINDNYKGIGFEWDMYDSMNNWNEDICSFTKTTAENFKPSTIRLMFDIDKYCISFGETNTPVYDFNSESMMNVYDILDYCQLNNIDVVIGIWHARFAGSYVFDAVKDEGTELFARVVMDMVDYVINVKEYSCIKYLVPYNEPNFTRRERDNVQVFPYTLWSECITNLVSEYENRTFKSKIEIAGPDVSTLTESGTWLKKAESDFSETLGIYEMHIYPSEYLVTKGKLKDRLTSILSNIQNNDRPFWIYESGISDGIIENYGQSNIKTFDYGINMADLTLQTAMAGVDGIVYWSFDTKMHQSSGVDSDFGLINSKTKELRPWYYSSLMLSRSMTNGSKVYLLIEEEDLRAIIVENETSFNVLAVNQSSENKTINIKFNTDKGEGEIYSYIFNEENFIFSTDGNILPSVILNGKFKEGMDLEVKANSFTVISTNKF